MALLIFVTGLVPLFENMLYLLLVMIL